MITPSEFEIAKALVRKACAAFPNPGEDFEFLTGSLLREVGFFAVQRQNAGSQFGRDYTAELLDPLTQGATHWYFECKNYQDAIRPVHVAEKLLWHVGGRNITGGFVIVGPSYLSNDLREMLEHHSFRFSIYNWTDDNFVKLVLMCPNTTSRFLPELGLVSDLEECARWRRELLSAPGAGYRAEEALILRLTPENNPPYQFAYFLHDGEFQKCVGDFRFVLLLHLFNTAGDPLIVHTIRILTASYKPLPRRVLVEMKAKGEYNPLRLQYTPAASLNAEVEILRPKMRELKPRESELIRLELKEGSIPGIYELDVLVGYDSQGRTQIAPSQRIRVCVCDRDMGNDPENRLVVQVHGKHYDFLAKAVLELSPTEWARINRVKAMGSVVYLGPSILDIAYDPELPWTLQRVRVRRELQDDGTYLASFEGEPETLLELGSIPGESLPEDPLERFTRSFDLYGIDPAEFVQGFVPPESSDKLR